MSKPSWKDAPPEAKILVQNDDGYWFFGSYESANPDSLGGWTGKGKGKWFRFVLGTPSDNWRNTFERRPIHWPTDDRIDTIGHNGNTGEHYAKTCNFSGLSGEHYGNKYTRHYKGVELDVYDVLKAFNVTCPALQHLIKKALCAGLRGHKNLAQDLQDIVDSAKRAKELNE